MCSVCADGRCQTKLELFKTGAGLAEEQRTPCAHGPTDHKRWFVSEKLYRIADNAWGDKICFEPYFVAPASMPRFDERFRGYGGDKSSHAWELKVHGWAFSVVPDAFILHQVR